MFSGPNTQRELFGDFVEHVTFRDEGSKVDTAQDFGDLIYMVCILAGYSITNMYLQLCKV